MPDRGPREATSSMASLHGNRGYPLQVPLEPLLVVLAVLAAPFVVASFDRLKQAQQAERRRLSGRSARLPLLSSDR